MEDKIKTIVIDGVDFSFNLEMAYEKDGHVYCRRCKEKIDSITTGKQASKYRQIKVSTRSLDSYAGILGGVLQ